MITLVVMFAIDFKLALWSLLLGQNVRLAARLTGWKIDIGPQSQEQEIVEQHEQLKAQTQAEIDKAVDDLFADDFDFE